MSAVAVGQADRVDDLATFRAWRLLSGMHLRALATLLGMTGILRGKLQEEDGPGAAQATADATASAAVGDQLRQRPCRTDAHAGASGRRGRVRRQ